MSAPRVFLAIALAALSLAAGPRQTRPLNDDWIFEGRGADGVMTRTAVVVPHTWNGIDAQLGLDYVRGAGTYTRTFTPGPELAGRRVFLRFEGANTVADVSVDDVHVGQHRGGYSAFAFEITAHVQPGRDHRIVVKVDNSPQPDVMPLGGDFNIYGGLYRPVQLITTGPICIDPLDFASPGVYLKQKDVSADSASIDVVTLVSNAGAPAAAVADVTILDHAGAVVVEASTAVQAASGRTSVTTPIVIRHPRFWNGRVEPYLYRARVRLRVGQEVVDEVEQPLGIRTFRLDPERGAFLNGAHVAVRGVSRHQDMSGKGSALTDADHDRDMALMLEVGANAVRLAHYQHADYFYQLCDRAGLLVWAEIPWVGSLGPGFANTPAFKANARQQMTELIRQNFNHPSVVVWGLSNELSAGSGDTRPDSLLTELNTLTHTEDPSRLTVQASLAFNSIDLPMNLIPDAVAFNEYFGWYHGGASDLGPWADRQHRLNPRRAFAISEYGAGASTDQHAAIPRRPFPMFHPWHPEEYQALVHEQNWRAIAARPFIWGSFVWNMFDFGSGFRREGSIDAINDKGLVTYDRAVRKDAFFFYKANWNPEPMVYLTSRRYVIRDEALTPIKAYSNLERVTLTVNGAALGGRTPDAIHVVEWPDVRLRKGNNVVVVEGTTASGAVVRDSVVWVWNDLPLAARVVPAFFRWWIKPLYVVSVLKLLVLYVLGFRRTVSPGWRRFWRVCFVLCLVWCLAIGGAYAVARYFGLGLFDYSQF